MVPVHDLKVLTWSEGDGFVYGQLLCRRCKLTVEISAADDPLGKVREMVETIRAIHRRAATGH
ncbi:MAG TPA: hypothetical protein VF163_01920 [Micromonosporaceae bacterium]